jgi:hypothetical protein
LLTVVYEVDPSVSLINDEHQLLAKYLKARFLTIEIYDADARFHYASCKVPMYELLRQSETLVVRGRQVEVCDPCDSSSILGTL